MTSETRSRTLIIDDETVVFEIETIDMGATGRIPTPRTQLSYRVLREGRPAREGVLTEDVVYGPVSQQFSDGELVALYRQARNPG